MIIIYHDEHIFGPNLCRDLVEVNEETRKLQPEVFNSLGHDIDYEGRDIPDTLRGCCYQVRDIGFSMSLHCLLSK